MLRRSRSISIWPATRVSRRIDRRARSGKHKTEKRGRCEGGGGAQQMPTGEGARGKEEGGKDGG